MAAEIFAVAFDCLMQSPALDQNRTITRLINEGQDPISVLKRLAGAALVPSLGIVVAFGSDGSRFPAPILIRRFTVNAAKRLGVVPDASPALGYFPSTGDRNMMRI